MLDGGEVALLPEQARAGDEICLLFGCPVPVVLRPLSSEKGEFNFVGECYVEGMMFGEGLFGRSVKSAAGDSPDGPLESLQQIELGTFTIT